MKKGDPYPKVHIHVILEHDSLSSQLSFCRETCVWDGGKGVSKVYPGSQGLTTCPQQSPGQV